MANTTKTVTVTTAAAQLLMGPGVFLVRNDDSVNNVFIGEGVDVKNDNTAGLKLGPGASATITLSGPDQCYAIASAGTPIVQIFSIGTH